MSNLNPLPTFAPLVEQDGKATREWLIAFEGLFTGDVGTKWTPVATSLTVTGAAPTITGNIYQISSVLAVFTIKIIPGTDTSSTAGVTYFSGFPLVMSGDGACLAVSGLLGTNAGMVDSATGRIYPPGWSAVTVPLTIIGLVEAS